MTGKSALEIEAKFSVPDEITWQRLLDARELAGFRLVPGPEEHVTDSYRDTVDRAVYRAGYACRIRRKGGQQIATLKALSSAEGAVHERMEYSVTLDGGEAPDDWPASPARDRVLALSQGAPLYELFSLSQQRHKRMVQAGDRLVAELSLDAVTTHIGDTEQSALEVEVELLDGGTADDLALMVADLKDTWQLQPQTHSKFERGLRDLDGEDRSMRDGLTVQEQATLERIVERGKPVYARRARLLLLRDQGLAPKGIALQVGLSLGMVYYWLRRFKQQHIEVFPAKLLAATTADEPAAVTKISAPPTVEELPPEPTTEIEPAKAAADVKRPEVTVEELCRRYQVDMAHARHVADLGLALFDMTIGVHGLPAGRRHLLETAAILHNVGFAFYPEKHHTAGRDIILEHRLTGLAGVEQQMLACTTAFHRKRFKPKRLEKESSFLALPAEVREDTLALAALLRMADGLDYSQTQTTSLGQAQPSPQAIVLPVIGLFAEEDAARAQEKADLWHHLFDVHLRFMVKAETQMRPQPEEIVEVETAPPKKLKAPGVLPEDPMSEAGRKVLHFHFERMLDHEAGTRLGEDIEELHDMRVATRRMRSAFRVFADHFEPDALRPFLKGLRRTGRALGSVRDLDVFMEKAQHYLDGLPQKERSVLDPLLAKWQEQRDAARTQMLEYLDGAKYQQFIHDFGEFLLTEGAGALPVPADKPVPHRVCHVVPALIYDRYEVVRGYETVIDTATIETLHALRIDCKRLRYSLEFFREVLGPEAKDVIKEVVVIQDHLGNLHDADVACGLLVGFLDAWSRAEQRERIDVSGVTSYLVAKQNELRSLVDSFPGIWGHFDRREMRRQLALAVSAL